MFIPSSLHVFNCTENKVFFYILKIVASTTCTQLSRGAAVCCVVAQQLIGGVHKAIQWYYYYYLRINFHAQRNLLIFLPHFSNFHTIVVVFRFSWASQFDEPRLSW